VRVEVRATRLKALREVRGLTQRRLAHDLGFSQNYVPAIEANTRQAGPKLQQQLLLRYFGCRFEDLFEVVLIDPETHREQLLGPKG
jgi:transcriptional regulator with XRE-family HTH domain